MRRTQFTTTDMTAARYYPLLTSNSKHEFSSAAAHLWSEDATYGDHGIMFLSIRGIAGQLSEMSVFRRPAQCVEQTLGLQPRGRMCSAKYDETKATYCSTVQTIRASKGE